MLMTGREACCLLETVGMTRRQGRQLLAAGFAGRPIVTARAHRYDARRVEALAAATLVESAELDELCPRGLFIARRHVTVAPVADPDPDAHREAQLAALREGWDCSIWTRIWLRVRIQELGSVPFVATVCGFVALGADLVDLRGVPGPDGVVTTTLELRDPGPWFEALRGRRLPSGRGRPWVIRGWPPYRADVGESTRQARPHRQESA